MATQLLVVDDDADQLDLRRRILEGHGFTVTAAGSVDAALAACAGCHTAVMDLRLPKLEDGLRLIRGLRAQLPDASLIVLTGLPEDLSGRPESALVDRVLRKGGGAAPLVDILHSLRR